MQLVDGAQKGGDFGLALCFGFDPGVEQRPLRAPHHAHPQGEEVLVIDGESVNGDFARAALKSGMVDRIGTRAAFGEAMAKRVGAGEDDITGSFNAIELADYANTLPSGSGDAIGIVYVAGEIVDGEAPSGTAGGDTIAQLVEDALADDSIKALVVRIDSPGGSVTASERIREALARAKAEGLPVVASFGPVAASGGIGVFHAGVEQKWWKGPSACSATDFGSGDFLTNVMAAPVVQCDQIAWSLAGISMAGYNGIISLTIAGVAVWLIRKD